MKVNLNALSSISQLSVSKAVPFASMSSFALPNITGIKNQSMMPNKMPSFISAQPKNKTQNNTKSTLLNQEKSRRKFPSISSITKPFQNNLPAEVKIKEKISHQPKKTEYTRSNSFSHMGYIGVFPESNIRFNKSTSARKTSLPSDIRKTEPSTDKNTNTKTWFTNGIKSLFYKGNESRIDKNSQTKSSNTCSTLPNYKKNMMRLDKGLDENMRKLLADSEKTREKKEDFIHINLATSYNANLDRIIKNAMDKNIDIASERMQGYLQDVGGYIKSLGVDGGFNSIGVFEANLMSNPLRNNMLQTERSKFSQEFTQVDDMNMFEEILRDKLDSVYTKGLNKFLVKYGPPGSPSLKEHLNEKFDEHFPELKTQ